MGYKYLFCTGAFTACNKPGQSAWSLITKPASTFLRRALPLTCIHPLHTPTLYGVKLLHPRRAIGAGRRNYNTAA